ncbi:Ubiquitin carboxyl-terminal hydrolase 6 [Triticum urartu]|uniref:Ubiquitin carboxyl-terminal hydrolase n=1 Tax=Triticum urartu TaxID=4572 RepID=M7Y803_TRIUA|nr:Ubiquitin carboxyl-terminal hydrolase 6 [Triticum urartu]
MAVGSDVCIKWQKQVFPGIEIDTSQPPMVFKTQLYTLTGVPPERQKIMVKGGILKFYFTGPYYFITFNDTLYIGVSKCTTQGQKLMMIGTADEIVKAPEKGPVFVEDLPEEEQAAALVLFHVLEIDQTTPCKKGHSAGLYNLGNTCYMNSTLQCLHSVPELKSALLSYSDNVRGNGVDQASHSLTVATRNTFGELDQSVRPVAPLHFLQPGGGADPGVEPAEGDRRGGSRRGEEPTKGERRGGSRGEQNQWRESGRADPGEGQNQRRERVAMLPPVVAASSQMLRKKYPQFAQQQNNVYMQQDAEECWTQLIYTLSQTLTSEASEPTAAQMKELFGIDLVSRVHCAESGEESSESESVYSLKCHISHDVNHLHEGLKHGLKTELEKKVDYPLELDVYDFCSDELKLKLQTPRQVLRDAESAKFGLKVEVKTSSSQNIEKQLTGIYDLIAVLTHKGRSADSGHYVGWVKQDDGKWIEFDDDNPSIRKEEEILKLSGGGDWHMAYICLYKARVI